MDTKEKRRPSRRAAPSSGSRKAPVRVRRRPSAKQRRADIPEVVYTQPPAFNRSGFLIRLATVAAVVLALTLGMSIFFKVKTVTVSGNEKYSAWSIRQASGIQEGDNLLTLSKAMISGKIITELPYVKQVQVGIKLPDTVKIEIAELDVAYAIEGQNGWWLINSDGKLLQPIAAEQAVNYSRVLGVSVEEGEPGQQAVAYEPEPETTQQADPETSDPEDPEQEQMTPDINLLEEPVLIPASQRLDTAVAILRCLEEYSIIGNVTSVDVTTISQLELWYENRYQVSLGDSSQLDRKIRSMKETVAQMTDYQSGELDVSFTTWTDMVGFTPFSDEETENP